MSEKIRKLWCEFPHPYPTRFPRRQEYANDLQLYLIESSSKKNNMILRENEGDEEKTIELPHDEHDADNHPVETLHVFPDVKNMSMTFSCIS